MQCLECGVLPDAIAVKRLGQGSVFQLFHTAGGLIDDCPCETGCTSCVGVPTEPSLNGQRLTRKLLAAL